MPLNFGMEYRYDEYMYSRTWQSGRLEVGTILSKGIIGKCLLGFLSPTCTMYKTCLGFHTHVPCTKPVWVSTGAKRKSPVF